MTTDTSAEDSAMHHRKVAYTLLFCIYVGCNCFGTFVGHAADFSEILAFSDEPPFGFSTFQMWIFIVLGAIWDALFVTALTALLAYHWRGQPTHRYILLGLGLRGLPSVVLLLLNLRNHSPSDIVSHLLEWNSPVELLGSYSIQLAVAVYGAFCGACYGRDAEFMDAKDEDNGYIGGVSKRVWAVIVLLLNPITNLVCKLTIVLVFSFLEDITSAEFWRHWWDTLCETAPEDERRGASVLMRPLAPLFFLAVTWAIPLALIGYGCHSLCDKDEPWRKVKLFVIFVALPVAVVAIPLIRNRTWVF
jgi:hypothetical protein